MKKILLIAMILFTSSAMQAKDEATQHSMTATDMNGNTIHITGTKTGFNIDRDKGKVVFLEFFGHMCPPCMASIPHYNDLVKKHKGKLDVIAIEAQGLDDVQLREFAKQKGINYTLLTSQGAGEFYTYLGNRAGWKGAIPYLIATDTKGNVKFIKAGLLSESELESLFQKLSN